MRIRGKDVIMGPDENALKKLQNVRLFVMDMDGTIYLGNELFPFTKPFLRTVEASGRDFVYFTNNSSKNRQSYLDKLARLGIPVPEEKMYNSTQVIAEFLAVEHPGEPCYAVGTPDLESALSEAGCVLTEKDPAIVVLGFDTTLTYQKLDNAVRFLENGAVFYAVHEDLVCPVEGGHFMPDCGSIARLLTAATGRTPRYFGKPRRDTLDYLVRHTGFREEEIAFVGDRMYTDIAIADGTDAMSILVLTGETEEKDLADYPYAPDLVVPSLRELTKMIAALR